MTREELKATEIENTKGQDEFLEVEELIKETLEESKLLNKKEEEKAAALPKEEPKKSDFKATTINLPKKEPIEPQTQAPKKAPQTTAPKPAEASYEATFKEYKAGDVVSGTVIKVDQSGVLVDIKYKADGFILPDQLSEKSSASPLDIVKVGDVINVFIENLENKEGYVVLSKARADDEIRWKKAFDAYKKKTLLEGKVVQALQGGLVVECEGIRGFIPASQVLKKSGEPLESFKNKTLPVKVLEINRRQGKIVLSHKLAAGEKERFKSSKLFDDLEVGQVRHGKVSSIKSFGAFVDIGGIEGLIHLSELCWKRVKHPSEVVKMGQQLDVFVLGVDKVNKKVALGLKELQPDPWVNAAEHYKAGQVVKVKILRFAKFGAFAELDHSLEGLIHISEMAKERIQKPEDAAKIGDVVEVKILRVLPEEQRIGLSIKGVLIQKEKEEMKKSQPPKEETPKVTIGDIIAQKEKEKTEREAEEETEEPTEQVVDNQEEAS
ncbi:MAG: S1 RNA-binding domain-containing protein [Candidatus Saganbacteria bacterium]|nr:S1 RNA-binding domain-containing protein [Candidatus Saganbacteria bacterium]